MTEIINSQDQLLSWLETHFGHSFKYMMCDSRDIFVLNAATNIPSFSSQLDLNYSLVGQIGFKQIIIDVIGNTVIFQNKALRNRKLETLTCYLEKISVDGEKPMYTFKTHYSYTEILYLYNMSKIRTTGAYQTAVEQLKKAGVEITDANVAKHMATAYYTCVEDIPLIDPSLIEIEVFKTTIENEPAIEARLKIKGVIATPRITRFWLTCLNDVTGFKGSAAFAGEYVSGKTAFKISTDLRNRKAETIMAPGPIKVVCQMHYDLPDGPTSHFVTKTIDFSELPKFDYFNLV